ncbi:MAG TPA: hypothetical protein VM120_15470, partial [Bryobacteraceae bacterium]|nr:hypothetical protein [Bryobacteraceae bacterium]
MVVEDAGFRTFLGDKREPGEAMKMVENPKEENDPHMNNFLAAIRSRRRQDLAAEIEEAAISADLIHLANASYRTGRKLVVEPGKVTRFSGDEQANKLLTRNPYRAPYIVG